LSTTVNSKRTKMNNEWEYKKESIYKSRDLFLTGRSERRFAKQGDDMIDQMFERHCQRQRDIDAAFDKQILMC